MLLCVDAFVVVCVHTVLFCICMYSGVAVHAVAKLVCVLAAVIAFSDAGVDAICTDAGIGVCVDAGCR